MKVEVKLNLSAGYETMTAKMTARLHDVMTSQRSQTRTNIQQ